MKKLIGSGFKITLILSIIFFFFISNANERIYIFVSFSMKEEALKAYFKEAKKHNGILVMNGLLKNDFLQTVQAVKRLGIEYEIDPVLFEKFEITMVPVIVKIGKNEIKKISGHIRLNEALRIFKEEV